MTICRESLEAGQIDLSDVTDGARLDPVHPGSILRRDYLEPLGMSVYGLAGALGVSRSRINEIVQERRAVTAETALRLARSLAPARISGSGSKPPTTWKSPGMRWARKSRRKSIRAPRDAERITDTRARTAPLLHGLMARTSRRRR